MVQRRIEPENAARLREWFLKYMRAPHEVIMKKGIIVAYVYGDGVEFRPPEGHHAPHSQDDGFLVGRSQLCKKADMHPTTGSRWLGEGRVFDENYVPFAEYLRILALSLRDLLAERGHPWAQEVTVLRAFLEAGYLEMQDLVDFLETEGVEGWVREEDCLGQGGLDLRKLSEEGQLVVREMYNFWLLREESSEEIGH